MASDPDLLEAFRKQCRLVGPDMALLVWSMSGEVEQTDLLDIYNEESGNG